MHILSLVFSESQPLPLVIESCITRWGNDSRSYGSSVYLKPGKEACIENLIEKVKRYSEDGIFFAGDGFHNRFHGTITGLFLLYGRSCI
jgi:hypothetical protein